METPMNEGKPEAVDLAIHHGAVVTMNPARDTLFDGAVAVRGNRIVAVGMTEAIKTRYKATRAIDAGGAVVMPGLIDAHNHPIAYLLGGMSDDVDVFTAVWKYLYTYEAVLTPEQTRSCARGNFLEMIKSGTTCFNDPGGYHVDEIGEAAVELGIRGILNRSTRDRATGGKSSVPAQAFESFEKNLEEAEAVVRRWHGAADDRIRAWFGLRNIFNVSDELIVAIRDLAQRYDVGVHTHAASVRGENEGVVEIYGKRSLRRYYDLELFSPRLYLAHGGFPDDEEAHWIKAHDVKIAHCPIAGMKGAWGIMENGMITKMLANGVCIGLGTDTNGAAGSLDMFREMLFAAIGHRESHRDPALVGPYKALEMATIDGARACLWERDIGSLEAGKKADIIIVATDGPEWTHPGRDLVRKLVYCASGHSVDTVVIDGRVVMKNREILTVDEEAVKREVDEAGRAWLAKTGMAVACPWPRSGGEGWVPSRARPRFDA
jgi:5-methylthioadenosine/S-adenosylhomocysteine deaminase